MTSFFFLRTISWTTFRRVWFVKAGQLNGDFSRKKCRFLLYIPLLRKRFRLPTVPWTMKSFHLWQAGEIQISKVEGGERERVRWQAMTSTETEISQFPKKSSFFGGMYFLFQGLNLAGYMSAFHSWNMFFGLRLLCCACQLLCCSSTNLPNVCFFLFFEIHSTLSFCLLPLLPEKVTKKMTCVGRYPSGDFAPSLGLTGNSCFEWVSTSVASNQRWRFWVSFRTG